MGVVLLGSRLVLTAVFLLAGITKLLDRQGSQKAFADFGLLLWLASRLAIAVPVIELLIGLALIPVESERWAALAALLTLLVFVVGIGINLAGGRKPDCHCFGQLHSAPVGWSTIARNLVLAAVAGQP